MEIYNYHPEHKHFLGSSTADESPLEPGVWLIPAHATEIQPPEFKEGEIPIFDGTSWSLIEDKRGTYYDTYSGLKIINKNPFELQNNLTKEVPPEIPQGKILKWNDGWILEDIPVLTPQQKLEEAGLTIEDLKNLLGLSTTT